MTPMHETAQFRNSATHTIMLTFTVAGSARARTARRRADRVAEQIANAASRLGSVVDVRAVAGPSGVDGEILWPNPVHFSSANTGDPRQGDPGRRPRYLDPDYELALTSLAEAHSRARARRDADRQRRRVVGCANAFRALGASAKRCDCVYCRPATHRAMTLSPAAGEQLCMCGRSVTSTDPRCPDHRDVQIIVLDGDPTELTTLSATRDGRDPDQR